MSEKIGGWRDYRSLDIAPETDFFFRAQDAGFKPVFVPRLTVVKFPASKRKDAYRTRPNHDQSNWSQRIASEPDFEIAQLVRMIEAMASQIPQEMPIRKLIGTFAKEIANRTVARFKLVRPANGREIARYNKFKVL